jgi:flagellar hook-associated protein 1 FlgK
VSLGSRTAGASQFLGLNDFFSSAAEYDDYLSSYQASRTTALGLAGTLTFDGVFGTTTVNYLAGNDLDDIATAINANAVAAAANITASVVTDGTGYRLRIADSDGNNYFLTDSGTLLNSLTIKPRDTGVVSSIAVRSDIASDPSRVSRGTLSNDPALAASDIGLTPGDKSAVQNIANRFNDNLSFTATNLIAASSSSLSGFATDIVSLNATQARGVRDEADARNILVSNLKANATSISGVNLDEEMSKMIILENAYAASARVVTVTQTLFGYLTDMIR